MKHSVLPQKVQGTHNVEVVSYIEATTKYQTTAAPLLPQVPYAHVPWSSQLLLSYLYLPLVPCGLYQN